jgi:hypothetical protein
MRALLIPLLLAPRKRSKSWPHARPFILHSSLFLVPAPPASICVCAYKMRKTNYTHIHVVPIFVHTHTHSLTHTHTLTRTHTRAHTRICKHAEHSASVRPGPDDHSGTRTKLIIEHAHGAHGRAGSSGGDAGAVTDTHHRQGRNRRKFRRRCLLACHSPPALPWTANNVKEGGREHLLQRRLAVRVCPSYAAPVSVYVEGPVAQV